MRRLKEIRLPAPRTTTEGGALPLEHAAEQSVDFDYDAIDRACDGPQPGADTPPAPVIDEKFFIRAVIEWIASGDPRSIEGKVPPPSQRPAVFNRLMVVLWYLQSGAAGKGSLAAVAKKCRVRRATLNHHLRCFNKAFGVIASGQKKSLHKNAEPGLN